MALAADLPAAIIADLLGMHINTAIRWVRYAGRDWADYLAARAAEQDKIAKRRSGVATLPWADRAGGQVF